MNKKILIALISLLILISGCVEPFPEEQAELTPIPENAEILFVSNRDSGTGRTEIYSMEADGGNVTRITFSNRHHFIFGIDKSKRYIVASVAEQDTDLPFGLGDEDRRSVWLYDLETGEQKRLSNPADHAEGRTFSPDGQWIVFCMKLSSQGEDQMDLYKIKRDGSSLTRLTNTLTAIECDNAWSNDGSKIVYTYLDGLMENPRYVLNAMDTEGGNIKLVYDGFATVSTPAFPPGNYDPAWSPGDEWIVFERAIKSGGENWGSGIWHIFKVREDGSQITDLSELGGHADRAEYLPSYSPDGKYVVYGSLYNAGNQSHNDIFKMDSETGKATRITDSPANDMFPRWIQ